ncbi:MAG: hypothetical protein JWM04_109 [Verrucomicrobiales bacterium]|nr:hypothetical protein [Verrucomicrobiales bacterium]
MNGTGFGAYELIEIFVDLAIGGDDFGFPLIADKAPIFIAR